MRLERTRLFACIFIMLLGCLPVTAVFAEGGDQEVVSSSGGKGDFTIATGERIVVKNKGFSIIPPPGWEVHLHYPGLSLLMQVPFAPGLKYQRTVQIMTFKDPVYIDEVTTQEFEQVIIKKYSHLSQSVTNYRMRNHLITKMEDGTEGILYYSEFTLEDKEMMQAHILVSSRANHYLLTYTDVAEHFQGEAANEHLTQAWGAMTSIRVGSDAPIRFRKPVLFGFGLIVFLILIIGIYLIRHRREGRSYNEPSSGFAKEGDGESATTGMSGFRGHGKSATSSKASSLLAMSSSEGSSFDEQGAKPTKAGKSKGKSEPKLDSQQQLPLSDTGEWLIDGKDSTPGDSKDKTSTSSSSQYNDDDDEQVWK